jgi:hypothetical protein
MKRPWWLAQHFSSPRRGPSPVYTSRLHRIDCASFKLPAFGPLGRNNRNEDNSRGI